MRGGLRIGFLRQNSGIESANTLREEMRGVFRPLLDAQEQAKRLAAQMETLADRAGGDYKTLSAEYGRLQSYFETNDGYNIDIKINTVLNGMGFGGRDQDTVCGTLSAAKRRVWRWQSCCLTSRMCSCSTSRQIISIFMNAAMAGGVSSGVARGAHSRFTRPLFS